jgi:uncharacterized protein involved in response to NO
VAAATPRWALLALGFRPFFLVAQLAAVAVMALWVLAQHGWLAFAPAYGPFLWHAHEMVFGYTAAVVAGFLLTSVRNWTGARTATGPLLAVLVLVWLMGRLAPLLPGAPGLLVAALDLAFLPLLAATLVVPLHTRAPPRNWVFVPVLLVLTAANFVFHQGWLGAGFETSRRGLLLGVDLLLLLIAVVGGRVVPFFTERALADASPARRAWLEVLALGSLPLLAAARASGVSGGALAGLAGLAALFHGLRLAGWHDRRVWSVPLLWVLHLGYAWLVLGLGLTAAAATGRVPASLALHAFTAGAIGSMTIGMMARVALGHTGRPLQPAPLTVAAFALVQAAAGVRVLVALAVPTLLPTLVALAGALWCLGFSLMLGVYAPILTRPRVDGRPG